MPETSHQKARRVWKERKLPVLQKPVDGRLNVRFPSDEAVWPFPIRPKEHKPILIAKGSYWAVPRKKFKQLIEEMLLRWGALYVVQYFVEQKQCAPACRAANGFDCICACGGEFHGVDGDPGEWIDISEALSMKHGETYLSCRLLTNRTFRPAAPPLAARP